MIPWDTLGLLLAPFGSPWGPLWGQSEQSLEVIFQRGPKVDFSTDVCSEFVGLELIRRIFSAGVINYDPGPTFYTHLGSG